MAIIVSAVGTDGDGEGTEAVDDSVFCGQGPTFTTLHYLIP